MANYPLAIVGGCGSSGTTLLAHLLSRHPQVASGPEFNCFNHPEIFDIAQLRRCLPEMLRSGCRSNGYNNVHAFMSYREHYGIVPERVLAWAAKSTEAGDFLRHVHTHVRERFQRPVFVEKSPTNVYNFARLAREFPDIPLVHVIRDGRDVATSLTKRGFNLFAAGSRWLYDTLAGLQARGAANYLEVRYEELVIEPQRVLTEIFRHIGVDPGVDVLAQAARVEPGVYNEDWKARHEPSVWQQTPADPISAASVGRYRQSLSREDLSMLARISLTPRAAQRLCGPGSFGALIEHLGYDAAEAVPARDWRQRLSELRLELTDYNRRLSRFHNHRQWMLPPRYTRILAKI